MGGASAAYVNGSYDNIVSPSINTKEHTFFAAVVAEMLMSFALVMTVLVTATSEKVAGNNYFGVSIGFIVLAGIVAIADISGACFNPVVGIALPTLTSRHTDHVWVYVVADTLGAIVAAGLYRFWRPLLVSGKARVLSRQDHMDETPLLGQR
jgi:glycerol uptake facilitator-like aquaporin